MNGKIDIMRSNLQISRTNLEEALSSEITLDYSMQEMSVAGRTRHGYTSHN